MSDQIDFAVPKLFRGFQQKKSKFFKDFFFKQLEELIKNKVALLIANCYIICSVWQSGASIVLFQIFLMNNKKYFTAYTTPFSP